MATSPPLRVYYSYARQDDSFREDLEAHLSVLKRQGAIQDWSNRDIAAGHDREAVIDENVNRADIILLLVSADFLASSEAWDEEMTRALQRHDDGEARVIPILLRPVSLEGAPFARLEPLPTDGRPIARWSNRDEAWLDVAKAIGRVIEQESRQRAYPLPLQLPPSRFIGRKDEMETLDAQLQTDTVRMLTITGLFGIGKTRLAIEVARRLRRRFRDGVCPVMLSRFDEEDLVASDIRAALDAPETAGQSLESSLRTFLLDKQLLLVLDRFDTARSDESLQLVHELLDASPRLKVMITSREPIPIQYGYQAQLALKPLGTHHDAGVEPSGDTLSDAARLFIAFAGGMGYTVDTERDLAIVESICSKIGGHPQSINLVAGWLVASPLDQIDAALSEYLGLNAGEDDSLRQAWDESFYRLKSHEQSVLSQLSPFRGPFTREAARAVVQTNGGSPHELLPAFKVLAERGLLELEAGADGRPTGRYWIFETIRQYAKEKLDSGQVQAVQHRHAAYFLEFVEKAESEIEGERQAEWLEYVRDDYSNIRAALRRSAKAAGQMDLSMRLAGALGPYWYHRGDFTEARLWLKELLASSEDVAPVVRAKALDLAGVFAAHQGDYQEAIESLEEAQRLFQELDDSDATVQLLTSVHFRSKEEGVARCLKDLAWVTKEQRNFEEARKLCADSLERYRAVEDAWGIAQSTADLGLVLLHLGEIQQAIDLLGESLDLRARVVKQPSGLAMSRLYLGLALYRQGDHARAVRELRTSLEIADSIGFRHGIALAADYLGMVAFAAGSFGEAASYLLRSLRLRDQMGDRAGVTASLQVLAAVAARLGQGDLASQLLARADLGRQQLAWGDRSSMDEHSLIGIELDLDAIRNAADPVKVSTASLNGRVPTTAELMEGAMGLVVAGP